MAPTIKSVFEETLKDLSVDQRLTTEIRRYEVGFMNKNSEHTAFFGGNLTGVQVVRFMESDKDRWFHEILKSDEEFLEDRLHALDSVNPEFKVSSNVMSLSCIYLVHAIYTSALSAEHKREAMIDVLLVLQFKLLTSRLYRHFPYPADKATAEATYAELSNKFAIKIYGSWIGLLRARSEEIISNTSIHFDTIAKMDRDSKVIYMLNDVQGRLRDMLKNIYGVFIRVHNQGSKIRSISATVEHDGVEILKDRLHGAGNYTRYLKSVVPDRNSFIREELLRVVEKLMHSMPPKLLEQTLEFISDHYLKKNELGVEKVIDGVMLHSFAYLADNRQLIRANVDLAELLVRLRGAYTSSRSTDPDLLALREDTAEIVKKAVHVKTESVIASVRTGVLLYLVARAYTMRHYSSN